MYGSRTAINPGKNQELVPVFGPGQMQLFFIQSFITDWLYEIYQLQSKAMGDAFIKTPKDYKAVAHRIEEIKDAEPNTREARELKQLMNKIIALERRRLQRAGR